MDRPIGIFDSGLGGISTLKELIKLLPNENYIYYGDSQFAPYGIKSKEYVIERCKFICDYFLSKNVKAIIIACNTATSVAAPTLREIYKDIPILGLEPALKPAAIQNTKSNIVVMATPLTLSESKFNNHLAIYNSTNSIIKMPCPELVEIVENNHLHDSDLVMSQLRKYYRDLDLNSISSVVLGCTHFVFYKNYLKTLLPKNTLIFDGNEGVAKHLLNTLINSQSLNLEENKGHVEILNSSYDISKIDLSFKLLHS